MLFTILPTGIIITIVVQNDILSMSITQPLWEESLSTIQLYVEPYSSILMPTTESEFTEPSMVK